MKMQVFDIKFHWNLFLSVWTNDGLITDAYMRHTASVL